VNSRLDAPQARTKVRPHLPRRHALLGGTTTGCDARAACRVLLSPHRLVDGPAVRTFEQAFAHSVGAATATSFAAGRVGLYGILRSLDVGPGDEVLVPVPTHIVVANAVRYTGAKPVYVDCELPNCTLDLDLAAQLVTPRTRALIVQHTFGIPVDMHRTMSLARRHGLHVIEDCVHALGARYGGRPVGTFGTAAFFSTEETKIISTTMGGMTTTNDPELAQRLAAFQEECLLPSRRQTVRYLVKLLAYYLLTEPTVHVGARSAYEILGRRHPLPRPTEDSELRGDRPEGFARRLSNGQAAVGLSQLAQLDTNLSHRRQIARRYHEILAPHGCGVPAPPLAAEPAFVRYPVWVEDRSAVERAMSSRIVLGTWFTSVLEEALDPRYGDYVPGSCPRAEDAARHLINLPTHQRVSEQDATDIATRLIRVLS